MNNVLKFDPSQKRKPEPEQKKPQSDAARFVWLSSVAGPMGSALVLAILFSTSAIGGGLWGQVVQSLGVALFLGVVSLPFFVISLGPYALVLNRGGVLVQSIFVRRSTIAGGLFGVSIVGAYALLAGLTLNADALGQLALSVLLGGVAGVLISFLWAHVCWIIGGAKLSPKTNDNR